MTWTPDEDWEPEAEDDGGTVPCPYCRREIHEDSQRCPHCGNYISAVRAALGILVDLPVAVRTRDGATVVVRVRFVLAVRFPVLVGRPGHVTAAPRTGVIAVELFE